MENKILPTKIDWYFDFGSLYKYNITLYNDFLNEFIFIILDSSHLNMIMKY